VVEGSPGDGEYAVIKRLDAAVITHRSAEPRQARSQQASASAIDHPRPSVTIVKTSGLTSAQMASTNDSGAGRSKIKLRSTTMTLRRSLSWQAGPGPPRGCDATGIWHRGLPWAGCSILAARRSELRDIRSRALERGFHVTAMPAAAQATRLMTTTWTRSRVQLQTRSNYFRLE
jgi:hypothetical protein